MDVVGVAEAARLDEAWQQGLDVVVVGFVAAEFCRERSEGFGLNSGLGLLSSEAGCTDEACSAVVLRGGELRNRPPHRRLPRARWRTSGSRT